jgi:N-acetyl-alpha-D-muramate 1-phosphate uridylyltransferase
MTLFPVAILAGGLATRLGSLSQQTPKSLLEVAGRPFIHHQLRRLHDQRVRQVVLCVGHLGERIVDSVGNGSAFDMDIAYSFDGPELRGTGGAIRQALPLLGSSFFVLYGDSYLECNFAAVQRAYESAGKLALMTVYHNQGQWDQSNVEFRNDRLVAYDKVQRTDKMHYIDYGLGILHRRAFDIELEQGSLDLATVYKWLLERGELTGFEVTERFYEIGSKAGLQETRDYLAARF